MGSNGALSVGLSGASYVSKHLPDLTHSVHVEHAEAPHITAAG